MITTININAPKADVILPNGLGFEPFVVGANFIEMEKKEFVLGKLILLERLPAIEVFNSPDSENKSFYCYKGKYKCFCGKDFVAVINNVKRGATKSCGCYHSFKQKLLFATHGESATRPYSTWNSMQGRCYNKNKHQFYDYGGRGITVCEEWKDFLVFKKWALTYGYTDCLTIDRINGQAGYSPDNCRRVSQKIQNINQRERINKSGIVGVTCVRGRWLAAISINSKRKHLGSFDTAEEASDAYKKAKRERDEMYHKEENLTK